MAEGGGSKHTGLRTLSFGSEFVFDFYCELCYDDGKNVEAEGFCVDCGEYLCGSCYSGHRKTRQTRQHKLLNKDQMPKDTPPAEDRIRSDITTMCKRHKGKPIEFYCKIHKILACSSCFFEGHKNCSDIESIVKKSESILDSQEYADFVQTLKSLDHRSSKIIANARENVAQTKACFAELLKEVQHLKEEVILALDKLEQDIVSQAKKLVLEQEKKMTSISNKCNTVTQTTGTLLGEIQNLQSSKRLCQAYISMKVGEERIKTIQEEVCSTEEGLVTRTLKFEPNGTLTDFIEKPDSFAKISCEDQKIMERQQTKANKPVLMKGTHVTDIDIKSDTDNNSKCWITGSAVVSSNRLIIADRNNDKIKLFDTQTNRVISELRVSSCPWDITLTSKNQAVVTLTLTKKILLVHVADTLTLEREINMDDSCWGVAYSRDRLIVTFTNPGRLVIMDLFGNWQQKIQNDQNGKGLFQLPQYVCVSNDGDTLYVSDFRSAKVIALTFNGIVKSQYSDNELLGPEKICVDSHGHVYVCGSNSGNVHMLTSSLTKMKIILTVADGLDKNVSCVSLCREANKLYVETSSNVLKVYQLA